MTKNDLRLLDCTLRDGGYINEWNWGFYSARAIIRYLTKAGVDYVEVGFLRDVEGYDENVTVCNTIEELNRLLPDNGGETVYSAMAMQSNYTVDKLSPYSGKGIELIRITAHDYDIEEGLLFAQKVKDKGYKVSINPINIMGYSDEKILWIIDCVNKINPYQFSVVDTFGSMKRRDLDRIISLVDNNLNKGIRVALHLHENMSMACCLAQLFVDKHINRPIAIDGSLMGMGRTPGNLPIELIADYCNDYADKDYDIDSFLDAIQEYIAPLKGESNWGYTPAYFLSARYNLHRNYAEYFLEKGDLSNGDINKILSKFEADKRSTFDRKYAEKMYSEYKNNEIDDSLDVRQLKQILESRKILILAPGHSLGDNEEKIKSFISKNDPVVITINFTSDMFKADYAFFSNSKRYNQAEKNCSYIITSNIECDDAEYRLNYNSLIGSFDQGYNSYIMFLKFLRNLGISVVYVAGADGYQNSGRDYYDASLQTSAIRGEEYNMAVRKAIRHIGSEPIYLTDSAYK